MTERPADTDWTRMGPEQSDFKRRCDNLVPDGIDEDIWSKAPAAVRSFIRDALVLKGPKR